MALFDLAIHSGNEEEVLPSRLQRGHSREERVKRRSRSGPIPSSSRGSASPSRLRSSSAASRSSSEPTIHEASLTDVMDTALALGVYRREVGLSVAIDITFDFRSDTPPGQDPDALSPTLRRHHQLLWSKPLPSGAPFELDVTTRHTNLHHLSEL